jgi:hypothetical protein
MDQPVPDAGTGPIALRAGLSASLLAWTAWFVALGADVIGGIWTLGAIAAPGGYDQAVSGPIASFVLVSVYATVGLLLRRRRADHAMGWLLLGFGLLAGLSNGAWGLMVRGVVPDGDAAVGQLAAWIGSVVIVPAWMIVITAMILTFPDGRAASRVGRRLIWASLGVSGFLAVITALASGPLIAFQGFANPTGLPEPLGGIARTGILVAVAAEAAVFTLALASLATRYRSAERPVRHQIRWFAFGAGLLVPTGFLYVVIGLIVAPERAGLHDGLYALFVASTTALPVAILVAITRYRLYEIDRLISRTFVAGALAAILTGLYAASIRLFNALFVTLSGEESEAALVLTTLVLATTFTPIKGRLEKVAASRLPPEEADPSLAAAMTAEQAPAVAVDLDARIEAIARRVAREVVEEGRRRPAGR